jgi:hypothetical protein
MLRSGLSNFLTEAHKTLACYKGNQQFAKREVAETVEATLETIYTSKAVMAEADRIMHWFLVREQVRLCLSQADFAREASSRSLSKLRQEYLDMEAHWLKLAANFSKRSSR